MPRQTLISILPGGGSRLQLFRPYQPTKLTTPFISLIMYSLYWSKYFLHLRRTGVDFGDRDAVSRTLFGVETTPRNPPEMGIVARSAWLHDHVGAEIDTFGRYVSQNPAGWLFESTEWSGQLTEVAAQGFNGDDESAARILRGVIGIRAANLLRKAGRGPARLLESVAERDLDTLEEFLSVLVYELGRSLSWDVSKPFVLASNLEFTRFCVCDGQIGISSPPLRALANPDFHIGGFEGLSEVEIESLLNALGQSEYGRILLVSMAIDRTLREILRTRNHGFPSCYRTFLEQSNREACQDRFREYLPGDFRALDDLLERTALGWDMNLLLFSGEVIARHLSHLSFQDEEAVGLDVGEVQAVLDARVPGPHVRDHSETFRRVTKDLRESRDMLARGRQMAAEEEREILARFLSELMRGIDRNEADGELFARLASLNSEADFDGRRLTFYEYEASVPVFTGYQRFLQWSEGLLGGQP